MQRGFCSTQSFRNPGPFRQLAPPSPESLHGIPTSLHTDRVCVKDCTQGLCHLYPHTTRQKSIPQPHSFQGQGKLEIVIWVPKKKSKRGVGNTQHSLPLHHFIHENSEVQRGTVIIPRSHSLPAPRSIDFPPTKYSLYPWCTPLQRT